MIKNKNFNPLKYQPALDGIRALAITLVMFAHANFQLFKNEPYNIDKKEYKLAQSIISEITEKKLYK